MPFRLNEFRAKMQFTTSASMPHRIYKACLKTGIPSNTVYIQHAVCEALSRDLDIPLQELLDELPPPRGRNKTLFDRRDGKVGIGPSGGIESVGKVGLP
jgi:hypothetical protein